MTVYDSMYSLLFGDEKLVYKEVNNGSCTHVAPTLNEELAP